jgi:uncharacterized protein
MHSSFSQLPFWDCGLTESPEGTKQLKFDDLGHWTLCVELPSLWFFNVRPNSRKAADFALSIIGTDRRNRYKQKNRGLYTLSIANTLSCNLSCTYCYNSYSLGPIRPVKYSISQEMVAQCMMLIFKNASCKHSLSVHFIGGEPLLEWKCLTRSIQLIEKMAKECGKTVRFQLSTNATLLTRDKVYWLNDHGVSLFVSYDGPAEIHDRRRVNLMGLPSFSAVKRGITQYLQHYEGPVKSCRMTLDAEVACFSDLLSDAVERGFNDITIGYDPNQILSAPHLLGRLIEDLPKVESLCQNAYVAKTLLRFNHYNEIWKQLLYGVPRYRPCEAGQGYISIDPKGNFYPCHRYLGSNSHIIGTAGSGFRLTNSDFFKSNTCWAHCQVCWARRLCGGLCYATLDFLRLDPSQIQTLCILRRALITSAIRLFIIMKSQHNNLMDELATLSISTIYST